MLTYDLDKRGSTPLYDYLYQCIRQDIISGRLQAGERLPSKRTLAQHLSVGIITVANAYAQLAVEGYITSREKKGYFVEDVSSYRVRRKAAAAMLPEAAEREYFADFKANRISLQNFPLATWTRLMRETLSVHNEELLKTVPYKGVYELRKAIANYLAHNRAMQVDPSQIIIGAGTEYLYGRLLQMFGHACTFAIEEPGYKKFASISASFGNPWKYIPIDDNGLMIDKLEESGADVVHLSPANHFPTGIVTPIGRRQELLKWAAEQPGRYIIEDDYDSEFRFDTRPLPSLQGMAGADGPVVYLSTCSRSLAPGIRIAYMVLPRQLLPAWRAKYRIYSGTVSRFEQQTLARFIREGYFTRHLARERVAYKARRDALAASLCAAFAPDKLTLTGLHTGLHLLARLKNAPPDAALRAAAKAQGVALSLLSDYDLTGGEQDFSGTFVLGYGSLSEASFPEAGETLRKVCTAAREASVTV